MMKIWTINFVLAMAVSITMSTNLKPLCSKCYCSSNKYDNPYKINCNSLLLEEVPHWNPFLLAGTSNVDNVHIDLSFNHIKEIAGLEPSYVLDAIKFDNNDIKTIQPFAFANLTHLKYLSLKSNKIDYLQQDAFRTYNQRSLSIEILDLRDNQLHHLDDDAFQNLERLLILRLGGNPFGSLDGSTVIALNGLQVLSTLDLSDAALTDLPYNLINPIRHLEELDISKNYMKKVPEILQRAGKLLRLNLDSNAMNELDAASFIEMENIVTLNISYMSNLKTIYPGTFHPLNKLQILNCAHNPKLESIQRMSFTDHQRAGPTSMHLVNLNNNNLTTLSHELFEGIKVKTLDMQENPLRCTCHLTWLKQRALSATDQLTAELRCVQPVGLSGQLLKDVEIETNSCSEEEEMHISSFLRIKNKVLESYTIFAVILLAGLFVIIGSGIYIAKTNPNLRYTVMQKIKPNHARYSRYYDNESCDVYTVPAKQ